MMNPSSIRAAVTRMSLPNIDTTDDTDEMSEILTSLWIIPPCFEAFSMW